MGLVGRTAGHSSRVDGTTGCQAMRLLLAVPPTSALPLCSECQTHTPTHPTHSNPYCRRASKESSSPMTSPVVPPTRCTKDAKSSR